MFTKIIGISALVALVHTMMGEDKPLTLEEAYWMQDAKHAAAKAKLVRKQELAKQAEAKAQAKAEHKARVQAEAQRRKDAAIVAAQAAQFDAEVRKSMGL